MKVKDLYQILAPCILVQIGDNKGPITNNTMFEYIKKNKYGDSVISELIPRIDKRGFPYLAIIINE